MNTEQINELRKLAEAATPGPWAYTTDSNDFPVNGYVTVRDCIYSVCLLPYEGIRTDDRVTDNGLFIAAANPAAVLELIQQRDELLEALKDAREMVSDWAGYASPYFQEKHDIDGDLKKLDEAIAKAEG
jgi:hypothetical protein